jgi:hypothetical protein
MTAMTPKSGFSGSGFWQWDWRHEATALGSGLPAGRAHIC